MQILPEHYPNRLLNMKQKYINDKIKSVYNSYANESVLPRVDASLAGNVRTLRVGVSSSVDDKDLSEFVTIGLQIKRIM
jgi:hypothetical protein